MDTETGLLGVRTWAVTIFFALCSLALYATIPLLAALGMTALNSPDWSSVGAPLVLSAAASGFAVDLLRLLAANILPDKLPHQLKMKKILKQHLS